MSGPCDREQWQVGGRRASRNVAVLQPKVRLREPREGQRTLPGETPYKAASSCIAMRVGSGSIFLCGVFRHTNLPSSKVRGLRYGALGYLRLSSEEEPLLASHIARAQK